MLARIPALGLLIAQLALPCALAADPVAGTTAEGGCPSSYRILDERFLGHPVRVHQLDPKRYPRGEYRLSELFPESHDDELVLGWTNSVHAYVRQGMLRYDGDMFYRPGSIDMYGTALEPGVFFRFRNLPTETVERIRAELREMVRNVQYDSISPTAMTCVAGACSVLAKGGIRVAGPFGDNVLASRTFARMIRNGFVDEKGGPVEVEIYRTHPRSLENLHGKMKDFERVRYLLVATAGAGAIGFMVVTEKR